jgi:hypothetical protein
MLAVVFSYPPVQAAAKDFLNLFRVRHFTAIPIDPARLAQLETQLQDGQINLESLIADQIEVLQSPCGEQKAPAGGPAGGPDGKDCAPRVVDSPEAAGQLAGILVRVPGWLPDGVSGPPKVAVQGASAVRFTANTAQLQTLLLALHIDDVQIPPALDGAQVTLSVPASVLLHYGGQGEVTVLQSRSPEIDLPPGADIAQLGEIGLRIAGMSADEAHRFAQSIDWHSTLIIPIPANAASFSEVSVRGTSGLLITMRDARELRSSTTRLAPGARSMASDGSGDVVLLWAEGDMVYAVITSEGTRDVLAVAEGLR